MFNWIKSLFKKRKCVICVRGIELDVVALYKSKRMKLHEGKLVVYGKDLREAGRVPMRWAIYRSSDTLYRKAIGDYDWIGVDDGDVFIAKRLPMPQSVKPSYISAPSVTASSVVPPKSTLRDDPASHRVTDNDLSDAAIIAGVGAMLFDRPEPAPAPAFKAGGGGDFGGGGAEGSWVDSWLAPASSPAPAPSESCSRSDYSSDSSSSSSDSSSSSTNND